MNTDKHRYQDSDQCKMQMIKKTFKTRLFLICVHLCSSVVICLGTVDNLNAQPLSFPATRAEQQHVIQTTLNTPLNLRSVCFSADGKTLYVGAYKQVLIWSLADAKLSGAIADDAFTGMISAMTLCNDGKVLAISGSAPGSSISPIILIDTKSNNRIASLQQTGDTIMCLAARHDGKQLAVGTFDGNLTLWDLTQFNVVKNFPKQPYCITDVVFDDKDTLMAVSNRGGQVEVFEMTEGFPSKLSETREDVALAVLFEKGKTTNLAIAIGGNKECSVRLMNSKNPKRARKFAGTPALPLDICWASQSKTAYLAGSDSTIVSWSRMGRVDKTFKGHTDWVTCIALSPDEKLIASVSLDGTAKIWDAKQGLLLASLLQLSPQSNDWLLITSLGMFNASSPDLVSFFQQPDAMQSVLRKQWLAPKEVSEHLGLTAK